MLVTRKNKGTNQEKPFYERPRRKQMNGTQKNGLCVNLKRSRK